MSERLSAFISSSLSNAGVYERNSRRLLTKALSFASDTSISTASEVRHANALSAGIIAIYAAARISVLLPSAKAMYRYCSTVESRL